ncbi:TRAP transporter large permease subunit [Hoeflea prorocentri]|uniref:TRAP transporter large permease subunit n=1 Tax=Hoeflea prorocentri TaxID=1922333 RepID=A0A9X3UDP6_9HYPH|nr:TRAP transporter large permease subunit [Hoeflea prorocentri]MCY6379396.1 TRAP transporter large permease subunit [Hoeflea prorocentri]MDA5397197.1 TRAP transporter large permease subunit [Hoeflea prorocentri]
MRNLLKTLTCAVTAAFLSGTASITPPIGINIFTIASIGDVDIRRIALQIAPFLLMIVALMFIVIFFEEIAAWLPSMM